MTLSPRSELEKKSLLSSSPIAVRPAPPFAIGLQFLGPRQRFEFQHCSSSIGIPINPGSRNNGRDHDVPARHAVDICPRSIARRRRPSIGAPPLCIKIEFDESRAALRRPATRLARETRPSARFGLLGGDGFCQPALWPCDPASRWNSPIDFCAFRLPPRVVESLCASAIIRKHITFLNR